LLAIVPVLNGKRDNLPHRRALREVVSIDDKKVFLLVGN